MCNLVDRGLAKNDKINKLKQNVIKATDLTNCSVNFLITF